MVPIWLWRNLSGVAYGASMILLVLFFMPRGLFGAKVVERV